MIVPIQASRSERSASVVVAIGGAAQAVADALEVDALVDAVGALEVAGAHQRELLGDLRPVAR